MSIRRIILSVAIAAGVLPVIAQQDAVNSQFMMNRMYINPGYTGHAGDSRLTAIHRSQWIGFKGAPMTQVISYDTPLKNEQLGVGGFIIHDKLGPTSRIGITGDFSYTTRLADNATLSWGAQASLDVFQINLTDLSLYSDYNNIQDEVFLYNTKGLLVPNVGFGAYYDREDYFIGLSCPKMLRPRLVKKSSQAYQLVNGRQEPVIYLMGGKDFVLNEELTMKPAALIRAEWNAPLSIGLYANAVYMENYTFGLFYHIRESAGLMFQWQIKPQLKVGYSFDLPTSALIRNNWGSHELAVNFVLPSKDK